LRGGLGGIEEGGLRSRGGSRRRLKGALGKGLKRGFWQED